MVVRSGQQATEVKPSSLTQEVVIKRFREAGAAGKDVTRLVVTTYNQFKKTWFIYQKRLDWG